MSVCPLISFPKEKSIGETHLPSEGCLESTESELQELDDPGNITMKVGKTTEFPSFSTEIDLSSRLDIVPSLVQETAPKDALSPLYLQVILSTQGVCNYLNFITCVHFPHCYDKPIRNFIFFYLLYFVCRLLPWWLFMTYNSLAPLTETWIQSRFPPQSTKKANLIYMA